MRLLARLFLVYWILGSFFPQADFSQMANLASLYQHFKLHQAEATATGQSITVAGFFLLHYPASVAHQHPGAPQSHQDLPLKSLQDVHWVDGRQVFLPLFRPADTSSGMQRAAADSLQEGIPSTVFRPPLTT
ncbi:MAG: hypothetical protein IPL49_13320 [Saprospirales bacterium]|nr:hypothetical protein [Saprospirales bacterium]MBK8491830.1 hypothetical protein [Saprospirales bacterium]